MSLYNLENNEVLHDVYNKFFFRPLYKLVRKRVYLLNIITRAIKSKLVHLTEIHNITPALSET